MIIHVGSILHSYTEGRSQVECNGSTLRAVLADLDKRYPGARFRIIDEQDQIRPHVKIFLGQAPARNLATRVGPEDELHILGALSGG